jgi:hypothetical protein
MRLKYFKNCHFRYGIIGKDISRPSEKVGRLHLLPLKPAQTKVVQNKPTTIKGVPPSGGSRGGRRDVRPP